MRYKFIIGCFILLIWQISFSWNFIGHAVIAQIAYDNLTPKAKTTVNKLVATFATAYPKTTTFQRLAAWPDNIRQDGMSAFTAWHFINLPFSPDKSHLPYYSQQNIVWAIAQFQKTLATAKQPFNKALALAFLTHFVGDIEQPLHCANRITAALPHGDRGGNLYVIKSAYATNLHSLWDQGLGLYVFNKHHVVSKQVLALSHIIEQRYSQATLKKALMDNNPYHWAKHSFYIAKYFAYSTPENKQPSSKYIAKGQKIVMRQTALAGYRLAIMLNNMMTS